MEINETTREHLANALTALRAIPAFDNIRVHGPNETCPYVRSGNWQRCHGHRKDGETHGVTTHMIISVIDRLEAALRTLDSEHEMVKSVRANLHTLEAMAIDRGNITTVDGLATLLDNCAALARQALTSLGERL